MPKVREFLRRHKQFLLGLYLFIYVPWFIWLEQRSVPVHLIHTHLDDMIPFCEYFVLPYYAWFGYVGITAVFIAIKDGPTCWKMGLYLLTGMTLFLIVSTVYPNGQDLRPVTFAHDNFCVDLVKNMYATDTPTNILPSLHVYNAIGIHCTILESPLLKKFRKLKIFSGILMVLIVLSTMFIKQHSVVDVCTAILLAGIMYLVSYVWMPHLVTWVKTRKVQNKMPDSI